MIRRQTLGTLMNGIARGFAVQRTMAHGCASAILEPLAERDRRTVCSQEACGIDIVHINTHRCTHAIVGNRPIEQSWPIQLLSPMAN